MISPRLASALFVYLVSRTGGSAKCLEQPTLPSVSAHPSLGRSHPLRQAGDQSASILMSWTVTQEVSELQKVKPPVTGQDQNRIGVFWPPCLLFKYRKDKRSDSWAVKQTKQKNTTGFWFSHPGRGRGGAPVWLHVFHGHPNGRCLNVREHQRPRIQKLVQSASPRMSYNLRQKCEAAAPQFFHGMGTFWTTYRIS